MHSQIVPYLGTRDWGEKKYRITGGSEKNYRPGIHRGHFPAGHLLSARVTVVAMDFWQQPNIRQWPFELCSHASQTTSRAAATSSGAVSGAGPGLATGARPGAAARLRRDGRA